MDTLDKSDWDVVIVGTGLQQSLLALALSRSDKKVLHVDQNDYYGGAEAAFSLQEAERWASTVSQDPDAAFSNVLISQPAPEDSITVASPLRASRAYSLALSPQLIYAQSTLLQKLVSSKVYRQLEFLAVGSWWVYFPESSSPSIVEGTLRHGRLLKVPSGREDVFQDQVLDFKAKRALMKFLRFIMEYEEQSEVWEGDRNKPFVQFLSERFKIPAVLQAPLLALALSTRCSNQTTTEYALPQIARHLRSIGTFGAGFGAVVPKWGGMSEIAQVACRALAVGGGVYVLGKGLNSFSGPTGQQSDTMDETKLRLKDGETISTKWIVREGKQCPSHNLACCRSITIISSPLEPLFPPIAEEAPAPAATTVVFPSGSLSHDDAYPVHVLVHSSDTGECPPGQSILYASTADNSERGVEALGEAVNLLLRAVEVSPAPSVLWTMQYEQRSGSATESSSSPCPGHILEFQPPPLDLAFDDAMLDTVKRVWQRIMGDAAEDFMVFEDRDASLDED